MRTRICLYILLLMPLAVYWQTVFEEYGFRDDYTHLRESREETGAMVKVAASYGRPLYGALLESTYAATGQVDQLGWMRLASVLILTLLGVVLWRQLYQSGWTEVQAAAVGLGITLLPSAQIVVGVASYWPQALTLLLSMAGFSAIETEIERGGLKRLIELFGGCMIYTAAGLIYQPNVLFAIVPMAAVYMVRTGREPISDSKWALIHLATLFCGLLLSYLIVQSLFGNGVFEESARMKFVTNPFTKLVWFFARPLPNALALFALADDNFKGVVLYAFSLVVVVALFVVIYRRSLRLPDPVVRKRWQVCLFGLPFLAVAVNLAAAENIAGYRILFTLAGLVLMLVVHAISALVEDWKVKPLMHYSAYCVLFIGIAFMANRHSYDLVAAPQSEGWKMMRGAALRANLNKPLRVYVITPSIEDRSTDRVYADEFGVPSSSVDRVAQEMFKAAVRTRFPDKLPPGGRYTVESGKNEPESGGYDLVIDMRKLKELRGF